MAASPAVARSEVSGGTGGGAGWQSQVYRVAAQVVGRVLATTSVSSIYVRRSVAVGEARIPRSDLDLAIVLHPSASYDDEARALGVLLRRRNLARAIFPRLGEVLIYGPDEVEQAARIDPYRGSIDRRASLTVFGEAASIPALPIRPWEAARRLVFWFDNYIPRALRQRDHHNMRKFAIEMWMAWRVVSGEMEEPFLTRRQGREDWMQSGERGLLAAAEASVEGAFAACLRLTSWTQARLRKPLPRLARTMRLEVVLTPWSAPCAIEVLPSADSAPSVEAIRAGGLCYTPEVLDLMLRGQQPFWWCGIRGESEALGLEMPLSGEWLAACARFAGADRLRAPGFSEGGVGAHELRLACVEAAVAAFEAGGNGRNLEFASLAGQGREGLSPKEFYATRYALLSKQAASLRERIERLCSRLSAKQA